MNSRRPLYLNASTPLWVGLYPPALSIKTESTAQRLYPLRRIDRILITGPVEWETRALLACAEYNIPIVFTNSEGKVLCRMVGAVQARPTLPDLLPRLFNRPDWETRYRQWCWAKNQQTRRYVANRLGIRFEEARDLAALPHTCLKRIEKIFGAKILGQLLQWMHVDLHALATACLQSDGLWNVDALGLVEPIDLARDITRILQPVLLEIRDREARKFLSSSLPGRRDAAQWIASHISYLNYQIARTVNHLEIWIMEGA